MLRLAARLRERGVAQLAGAGFLNYSQPDLTQATARLVAQGATAIRVLPYFLIDGYFVQVSLRQQVAQMAANYPNVAFSMAPAFGEHPALAQLVQKRANQAWPDLDYAQAGLLVMVHGSPRPASNAPIEAVAERVRQATPWAAVQVCFMDLNEPSIAEALDRLVAQGLKQLVAVPYFIQFGSHVREDLPEIIQAGRDRHAHTTIVLAKHLDYDELLIDVLTDRVAEHRPVITNG
ncbi:cobalamin (vitamin B12) biosynthesis CbiX protein [Herpetosiphon aurantiacus DSM 785]|uniref:Cobalamin (Vitamin B12) biosynthesis CbiX protein n=2 Tax=Herpetosiphon TaxID=64 RepID=A9B3I9_HERA2|nr:cobalamin (vitamin B12) biosynthesis CbiX protein [Herpetosiphon aurantiacus DSM 785]